MFSLRHLPCLAVLVAAGSPALGVTSSFDSSAEGWHVITYTGAYTTYNGAHNDYGVATYYPTGGNPGGYVRSADPDGGDTFAMAPSKFLGNASSAYGSALTYDLFDASGNGYNSAAAVVLQGAGVTICYPSATLPSTTAGTFTRFQIPLAETGWQFNAYGGAAVSDTQFKSVLANLTFLAVRLEYNYGADDSGLDNVTLPGLPNALLPGDANGDGKINADDYARTDRGFLKHLVGWENGDFNSDGVVDAKDYLILDTAYGHATGQIPEPLLAQRQAQFGAAYASGLLTAVPEPCVCLLTLPAVLLARRTRRSTTPHS